MLAVYDLGLSPVTYDFTHWLVNVEKTRLANKLGDVTVRFVLGDRQVTERDQHFTDERKAWRLHNLLVPLCRLLPSVRTYEIAFSAVSMEQPIHYKPVVPVQGGKFFKASGAAQSLMASWVRTDEPIVTITVRQSDLQTQRNSNIAEWLKVARWLKERNYLPIFVPDTEALMNGDSPDFEEFRVCEPAAMNPDLRLALYERALLNCFTSGGPFALAMYADLPFLLCKTVFEDIKSCSRKSQEKLGFTPENFSGLQRVTWAGDTADELVPILKELLPQCLQRERPILKMHSFAVQKPRRLDNIKHAATLGLPSMGQRPAHNRTAALVCYGPSLRRTWRQIPGSAADVFTVSGAHAFMLEKGVIPQGHVETDPRPHKAEFTKVTHPETTYYLASCCDPLVFENVKERKTEIWHAWDGDDVEQAILSHWPDAFLLLGGSNVGLRAIAVLAAQGYRTFDIYGMDCNLEDGQRHAGPHNGKAQTVISVRPQGSERRFDTTPQLIAGAQHFLELLSRLAPIGYVFNVHGDSLMLEMLRVATNQPLTTGEANGSEGRQAGVCEV